MKKKEEQTFLEFIDMTRADFIAVLNDKNSNSVVWTAAEDLINCFDRMKGYIEANEKQLTDNQNEEL